jgi:hypothetical protein
MFDNSKKFKPVIEPGQVWFVKLYGASALTKYRVVEVHQRVVSLRNPNSRLAVEPVYYKKSDVEFVELVKDGN